MLSTAQKILFLTEINSRKATLFGKFDDARDAKKSKMDAWEEIKNM